MAERTIGQVIEGREPLTAPVDATVRDAARLMQQGNAGALMVVEGERLVGVFTERDGLFRVLAAGLDAQATPLGAVMTRNPRTIQPQDHFSEALRLMHEGGFRNLPVVENGRPVGMVSVRDALGPELEGFVFGLLCQEQTGQVLA